MKHSDPTSRRTQDPRPAGNERALQGEGNYDAARRHRKSLKRFLDEGKVDAAAQAAAPADAEDERDMKAAENAGLGHGRH